MPQVIKIMESYDKLTKELDRFGKAFYLRFGDIDIFFMVGRNYKTGQPLSKAYGNNKSVWNKEFQKELRTAFKIKHPKFIKAISGIWPLERGMTNHVFGPFGHKKTFDNMVSEVSNEDVFYHPWLFQYLAVFEPHVWENFLDKYVRPKLKMFVGSTEQKFVEQVVGQVDFYIKTPEKDSYATIEEWYPQIENILAHQKEIGEPVPVIILNTGQASRVIGGRMWNNNNIGGHFLDFGSIFHAVAGIKDRWWIKEKGDIVQKRYAPKKFKHFVFTRMNYTKTNDLDFLKNRLELFEKYAYPSMLAQTNQDFKWVLLFDKFTPKSYYEKYLKYKNVVVLKASGEMDEWQAHFRNWIHENVDLNKLDFLITSRLDNDDVYHPEYIDNMQKCLFNKTHLVDSLGYQYDTDSDRYSIAKKYEKVTSPFITLIEKINKGSRPETVVKCDHTHMKKHFPLLRLQKRLFIQVVHGNNALNKINGDPIDKNINLFLIGASPVFLKMFNDTRLNNSYFTNRVNYLSEVYNLVEKENPETVLEIGPNGFSMFGKDTLDKNGSESLTYSHDITEVPWGIDKKYDMIVALQVWEHLEGRQKETFRELLKHTDKAVLSFPYKWKNSDEIHTGIDEKVINDWTLGVEPVSKMIVRDINDRIIYFFDFTNGQAQLIDKLIDQQSESKSSTSSAEASAKEDITTHFVYPTGNGTHWGDNNELKHSLRSLEMNFTGNIMVWIYGNKKPKWLVENDRLKYVQVKRGPSIDYENFFDTLKKLKLACKNPNIPESFVWMYDDQYFLKSFGLDDLKKHYAIELMDDKYFKDKKSKWWKTINVSYKLLKNKGFVTYNYETHLPRYFLKSQLLHILNNCDYKDVPFAPATVYFNQQSPEIIPEILHEKDEIKAFFYAEKKDETENWSEKYDTLEFINGIIRGKTFMNHNDEGLTDNLKKTISGLFKTKSSFEK